MSEHVAIMVLRIPAARRDDRHNRGAGDHGGGGSLLRDV